MKYAEFFLTLPFKVTFIILGFIVWEILSNGDWKQRKQLNYCHVRYWQDQAHGEARKNRKISDYYKKREQDREAHYQQELRKKEREISYLRSQLYR